MVDHKLLGALLQQSLDQTALNIPQSIQEKLINYIELLTKWNTVYNLTAILDPKEMIQKHLLDSLVVLPFLGAGNILDVGTGAGIPGIPLALANPNQEFVLLDSQQKKLTFVQHVILSLKLKNVHVVCTRVEAYQPDRLFDWVISRAFGSLAEFARLCGHLCKREGRLVAMKGKISQEETEALSADFSIDAIWPVQIPDLAVTRNLVLMKINPQSGGISGL